VAELLVLGFGTKSKARRALRELKRLQEAEHAVTLQDWALLFREADGRIVVDQAGGAPPAAPAQDGSVAIKSSVGGLVVGSLFLAPLAGVMVGALIGATVAERRAHHARPRPTGVDPAFEREAADVLQPGAAALFLHGVAADAERVVERLRPFEPRVVRTSISPEAEAALRARFAASA
jgi:uncharacterized membrane protein